MEASFCKPAKRGHSKKHETGISLDGVPKRTAFWGGVQRDGGKLGWGSHRSALSCLKADAGALVGGPIGAAVIGGGTAVIGGMVGKARPIIISMATASVNDRSDGSW